MPNAPTRRIEAFFHELKRRRVFRVAAAYVVLAFAALQGVDVLVPALHLPGWTTTLVAVLAIAGFIVSVGLAWAFDVTPEGVRHTEPASEDGGDTGAPRPDSRPGVGGAPRPETPPGVGGPPTVRGPGVSAAPAAGAAPAVGAPTAGAFPAAPGAASAATPTPPCIAVMPFLNLSPDAANEYFADGVTEDIIAGLSKIRSLRVISRTSVMPFKQRNESLQSIAATLGATTVVDGSVRREGDRVRIVAELIDAATDRHLWAETYDRQLTDIFAIQSDVAVRVAAALKAELSLDERTRIRREPTRSVEAYELYNEARAELIRFTPTGMERAIALFERALEIDPSFALAEATIAIAYAEMGDGGMWPGDVARERATAAADRALRLDPALSEAYTARGYVRSLWEHDREGAERDFKKAIELSPSSADAYDFYGRHCRAVGRMDEALEMVRRAKELDPMTHRTDLANALIRAGRYAEAAAEAEGAVAFDPRHDRAHATLAWAYLKQGQTTEGLAELERAAALSPDSTQWLAQLGQARAMTGDEAGAREVLHRLDERARTKFVSPYHRAFVHTGLGEHDRAIDLLEQSVQQGTGSIHGIRGSFLFEPLRTHPRFKALVERLNAVDAEAAPPG